MKHILVPSNSIEQNRFVSISDFKDCVTRGGEVEFVWNGVTYCIFHHYGKFAIAVAYRQDTEKLCDTPDEILEYRVGADRLRDVITQVTVMNRTI